MTTSKTKNLVLNGMIAALYIALTLAVSPVAQGAIQFRISEGLNHLVVFNRKLRWGVLAGVVLFNLFFAEFGLVDVLFGGGQTFIALSLSALMHRYIKSVPKRLVLNIVFFTVSMILIALMLTMMLGLPFWMTYATTALSELLIMSLSAPIMYGINKVLKLENI
ncbi:MULTISPECIES: QueT transporter family protein [Vagococcus]|uniref:Integral membrane protein n=1 Tax=Vagococcus lutrae LBD1 TaxID=1408226 RepID=V6Q4S4_9ENTE|nr:MULTISPECIES: QueT transporter family protein [Vagococcus]EST89762.1 integral membrane protein [Vagococcus lutrae LBD1]NKZ27583.1 QueT transporter family protein [Vagococcus lutrae]HCT96828.1 QueT transporter family protein [Vagococcus sp.]